MSSLGESKNEWCARLVNILTPAVIDGLKSIFKEALELSGKVVPVRQETISIKGEKISQ